MYAIVKFNGTQEATIFDQVIATYAGWELKTPLNSDAEGRIRILDIYETENDKALYEYLRNLGAFEEVTLE